MLASAPIRSRSDSGFIRSLTVPCRRSSEADRSNVEQTDYRLDITLCSIDNRKVIKRLHVIRDHVREIFTCAAGLE